jgi:hypothetical protein
MTRDEQIRMADDELRLLVHRLIAQGIAPAAIKAAIADFGYLKTTGEGE